MKLVKQLISTAAMNESYQYMAKGPMKNLRKMMDWAEEIMILNGMLRKLMTEHKS